MTTGARGPAAPAQVVVSVNGPGEISGWLAPFVTELKARHADVRVCVCLVPWLLSSGSERSVVEAIDGVDAVCSIRETWGLILRGRLPPGFGRSPRGTVLHLGGEALLSLALAWRLGLPSIAYVEEPVRGGRRFDQVVYTGFKPVPPDRLRAPDDILGEMMVDAARLRRRGHRETTGGRKVVGFYPGSRPYVVKYTLPFFAVVADLVNARVDGVEWVLSKSSFLSIEVLANLPDVDDGRPLEAQTLTYDGDGARPSLVTQGGARIEIREPAEAAAVVDVALTCPGTTTAELAAMGIPMVMVLPTRWGETAPLPAAADAVGRVPLVGRRLRRAVANHLLRRLMGGLSFVSHPNRRANSMLVPELIGDVKAEDVAAATLELLRADLRPLAGELRAAMGAPGAAARLVDRIEPYLGAETPEGGGL